MDIQTYRDQTSGIGAKRGGLAHGDSAPGFTATTHTNQPFNLADYSDKAVWISFLRYAGCPTCQLYMKRMADNYPEWIRDDFQILVVSPSSVENIFKYIAKADYPYPVICDQERNVFGMYGTVSNSNLGMLDIRSMAAIVSSMAKGYKMGKVDGPMGAVPCDFLIRPGGEIEVAHYGRHSGDHLSFDRVEQFIGIQLS